VNIDNGKKYVSQCVERSSPILPSTSFADFLPHQLLYVLDPILYRINKRKVTIQKIGDDSNN